MKESISPCRVQTDLFASQAANDLNFIHSVKAGKRQNLPGDWQVFFMFTNFSIPSYNDTTKVDFAMQLKPSTRFKYDSSGLYLPNIEPLEPFSTFSRKNGQLSVDQNSVIDVVLDNTKQGLEYVLPFTSHFGSLANTLFILNYMQSSDDIGRFLLSSFFQIPQKELTRKVKSKKCLPLFTGGEFSFDTNLEIGSAVNLERRALKPELVSNEVKGNKTRTKIQFPFILSDKFGNVVGKYNKFLICSYKTEEF